MNALNAKGGARVNKRICAALLAAALLLGAAAPSAAAADALEEYSDLDPAAWYAQGIRYCLERGLMNGYGKHVKIFSADRPITRAQLVTILWRMEGEPQLGLSMQYTDVPEHRWYTEAVRWATAADIMGGYDYLTFAPDEAVTREQLAAILWRYGRYCGGDYSGYAGASYSIYADSAEVSPYAEEAMLWACEMGIISGEKKKDGSVRLSPKELSSRAATATILMRFCLDFGIFA